jgi:5-methylcytosine-specific restriction enzyme subunit McrC
MYVLSVLRKAAVPLTVTHGTREKTATKRLLHSDITGQGLGTLIPDAILHTGENVQGVADAKYKSLHPSASAPNGPQREDLYQMAAYLARFVPADGKVSWGVLAYPLDSAQPSIAQAEQFSPWSLDADRKVIFTSLPHVASDATTKLRALIVQMAPDRYIWQAQAS